MAALRFRDRTEDAHRTAKTLLEEAEAEGFDRERASALARSKFGGSKLLRTAKKLDDELVSNLAVGTVHFLTAMDLLAAGKDKRAVKSLERSVMEGSEFDSCRCSAAAELERLE